MPLLAVWVGEHSRCSFWTCELFFDSPTCLVHGQCRGLSFVVVVVVVVARLVSAVVAAHVVAVVVALSAAAAAVVVVVHVDIVVGVAAAAIVDAVQSTTSTKCLGQCRTIH